MTQEQYNKQLNNLRKEIRDKYGFSDDITNIIVGKADMDFHAYCFEEVRDGADELAYFVQEILESYERNKQ